MNRRTAIFILVCGVVILLVVVYDTQIGNPENWLFSQWEGKQFLTKGTYALIGFASGVISLVAGLFFAVRGDS